MSPGQTLIARTAIGEPTWTYLRRSGQGSLRSSLPAQSGSIYRIEFIRPPQTHRHRAFQ